MPGTDRTYSFAAPLLKQEKGFPLMHYVPLPMDIADELQDRGVRRVECTMNGQEYRRAITGPRDGERYLLVSKAMMKEMEADYGDTVLIDLWPDPDPDRVELCEELVAVLDQDDEAAERFYGMTPGQQRGLNLHISGGKRSQTRINRALDIAYKLRTYTLSGDRQS
ncbi:MAG: YdeI/OmpD-associated family protein [Rubricoccaceae bacterium]|nr:YdeI/OmpD-associated family protein [Rubricoccaceae bacterium]